MTKRKDPLLILVAKEADGYTYRLHPLQKDRVHALKPSKHVFPMLFLAQDVQEDFETVHGPIATHLAELLTGLSLEKINQEGGVRFVKSGSEQVILSLASLS
jgi:hypothetical protein